MPRLSESSSSWHRFSTTRMMLPVMTDSSIDDVSTSVSMVESILEKSAFTSSLPATRSSIVRRSFFSKSAIRLARSVFSACRASRNICCSSRMSVLLARSISTSDTRSSTDEKDSSRRWTARSRQSFRILVISRGAGRRTGASVAGVAFAFTGAAGLTGRRKLGASSKR
jgi:hypothetical protein